MASICLTAPAGSTTRMRPRTEALFSGFAAMFAAVGSLFGHHLVGYRILALALPASGAEWLAFVTSH